MRRSQQAFSAPSKQTQSSNAKDELSSTASINASSTTLIPSSKLLASKPRDCTLKREQNSCYEHDKGLKQKRADRWKGQHASRLVAIIREGCLQATCWRRRRTKARRAPQAATRPGNPAPTIGPGTAVATEVSSSSPAR